MDALLLAYLGALVTADAAHGARANEPESSRGSRTDGIQAWVDAGYEREPEDCQP